MSVLSDHEPSQERLLIGKKCPIFVISLKKTIVSFSLFPFKKVSHFSYFLTKKCFIFLISLRKGVSFSLSPCKKCFIPFISLQKSVSFSYLPEQMYLVSLFPCKKVPHFLYFLTKKCLEFCISLPINVSFSLFP